MTTPAQTSPAMRRSLGLLLDLEPETRRLVIRDQFDQNERSLLLEAARTELGTPFGIWRDDPVGFVEDALGVAVWGSDDPGRLAGQRGVLKAIGTDRRVVVPSCHGAGKTFIAAYVVAWWIMVHPPKSARAPTTSEKWWKVRTLLWAEINRVHERHHLPGDCLTTEWQLEGEQVAWGISPKDTDEDAFSGIHAQHVLMVVDEAGALSPVLGQSLESVMASGDAKLLVIGNPPIDEDASPWFEERAESPRYRTIRIPTSSTPNFTGQADDAPACTIHPLEPEHTVAVHMPTPESVEEVADEYGTDSAYYIARILAKFPKDFGLRAIPRSWVEEAAHNEEPDPETWVRLGVDVAADGGDEFTIARADGLMDLDDLVAGELPDGYRTGHTVRIVHAERPPQNVTTFYLAGKVLEQIEEAELIARALGDSRPVRVKVDAIGLGMGVTDTLKAWGDEGRHRAEIIAVKVSESPTTKKGKEKFGRQRGELWWNGRELLGPRRPGPGQERTLPPAVRLHVAGDDDRLIRQLSAPSYSHSSSGKIEIEQKSKMKERGVQSPDRAEAVLLALYEPGYGAAGEVFTAAGSMRIPRRRSRWN